MADQGLQHWGVQGWAAVSEARSNGTSSEAAEARWDSPIAARRHSSGPTRRWRPQRRQGRGGAPKQPTDPPPLSARVSGAPRAHPAA